MTTHNIADETGVRVMASRCTTCIFRKGNLMRLHPGRVEEMVADAVADQGSIVCHSTLSDEKHAVCRGFFTKHATAPLQIAERLGLIVDYERTA